MAEKIQRLWSPEQVAGWGLLRQYFPKGINLADVSQAKLDAVARQLNERPRKTLDDESTHRLSC